MDDRRRDNDEATSDTTGVAELLTVHTPSRTQAPVCSYLRAVWERRDFVLRHSGGAMKARNARSILGPLWHVLNPLLLAAVYVFLFAVLRPSADAADVLPRVVSGIFVYYFTLQSVIQGGRAIIADRHLVLNATFPLMALPLSAVTLAARELALTVPVYAAIHVAYDQPVGFEVLLLIPLVVLQAVMNLGLAALVASIQTTIRDVGSFVPYFMRLMLYVTPVLYPVDLLPERLQSLIYVNPLAPMFILLQSLLEGSVGELAVWMAAFGWSIASITIGVFVFRRAERSFAVAL